MKISKSRFDALVRDNSKDIALYTKLVAEKKYIRDFYGYEEKGEEVSKYEDLLSTALDVKKRIDNKEIYF